LFASLKRTTAKNCSGLRKLLERSTITDLSDLDATALEYVSGFQIKFLERERKGHIPHEPEAVRVVEEAHNIFSFLKERTMGGRELIHVMAVRGLRRRGVGWTIVEQAPAKLPGSLLRCVDVTVCFGLSGPQNVRAMQRIMGLSPEKARFLAELDDREAVVQAGELGPAFLVKTPEINLPEAPSREELRARMEPIIKEILPDEIEAPPPPKEQAVSEAEEKPKIARWLTSEVREVLESVATRPHYFCEWPEEDDGLVCALVKSGGTRSVTIRGERKYFPKGRGKGWQGGKPQKRSGL